MATAAHANSRANDAHHADARKRTRSLQMAARAGYAAHGLVYALVAVFAIDAALGGGGEQAQGARGSISAIAATGWGTALLAVLAIGLLAYGLMRLWQGTADPAHHGADAKGIGIRVARVASGVFQIALAFYAATLAFGWFSGGTAGGGGGGGGGAEDLTARVMAWPAGAWIIGIVGVAIAVGGFFQLKKALSADFMDELSPKAHQKDWVKPTGRAGFAARFVVFLIVGVFLVIAAVQSSPQEARGLGGALRTLRDQPFGPWLLGLVALGLLAFAVTRGIFAFYKQLPIKDN